VLKHMCYYIKE